MEEPLFQNRIYTSIWSIWKEQKAIIFKQMKRPSDSVVEIISSLFGWIIHRYKHKECSWDFQSSFMSSI
ncbi:hypothetical protein HanIR_Chr11g0522471 [Helianthus annuus]|nr:hypothetical protein HanIR_Chr11g0522471 [Helianthus annuus]